MTGQVKSDAWAELKEELLKLHQQLLDRDDAFRAWDERVEALEREKLDFSQRLARAEGDIRAMQSTKLWRLGSRYWNTRDRVKRVLGRAG